MAVQHTDSAKVRLGEPQSTVERGTIEAGSLSYSRYWNWDCGCRGEIIAGALIEIHACILHACAA